MTADRLELISTDPRGTQGQVSIAGTRVPVSVILDCLYAPGELTPSRLLLAGLALVILGHFGALIPAVGGLAVVMLCAEAFARGQLVRFVAGLIALAVTAAAAWLVALAALGHWRSAIAIVLILAAAALLLASVRDFFIKR